MKSLYELGNKYNILKNRNYEIEEYERQYDIKSYLL